MSQWINFTELREQLVFADVLASYNVRLEPKGNGEQHVGKCPLPSHKDASGKTFSANCARGIWQCFGCHESGNVIDFAVLMEGKNKRDGQAVRAVAKMLKERFVEKRVNGGSAPAARKAEEVPRSSAPASESAAQQTVINQPLDFELKTLEKDHPFFEAQKLKPETVTRFGIGFCRRGSLSGRVAVPLEDDAGQLVAYACLAIDAAIKPRYLFPSPREHDGVKHVFDASKFSYNGHRIGKAVKDIIVVRECHTVWQLVQAGFANVVALMGVGCSGEQAANLLFLTSENARVWLLTDYSAGSVQTAQGFLPLVASDRFCRWIKVKEEEEIVPDHPPAALSFCTRFLAASAFPSK